MTTSSRAPGWLGPLRVPEGSRVRTLQAARWLGNRLGAWPYWLLVGLPIGVFPVLLDYATGWPTGRLLTTLLLTPLLVAAVVEDSLPKAAAAIGAAFLAHSALFIALAAFDPTTLAVAMPQGRDYWLESQQWIITGVSKEYEWQWWLPAHLQTLGAVVVFTYLSLGLATLWQGLYEVDLMNFYVGQLAAHSRCPGVALAVGWHPWSLCRGLGYLFLAFEVASYSCQRLTVTPLSTPRRRRRRWTICLSFLVMDGLLKFFMLESVRVVLANNLA